MHEANLDVYGAREVRRVLNREGIPVARRRVQRLMRQPGSAGVVRGKVNRTAAPPHRRTAAPAQVAACPGDLVNRDFTARAPNRLWGPT